MRKATNSKGWFAVSTSLFACLAACGSSSDQPASTGDVSDAAATQGAEGKACYPNGTCNTGLSCYSNLCVNVSDANGAGGAAGSGSGPTDAPPDSTMNAPAEAGADVQDTGTPDAPVDAPTFDPKSLTGLTVWLEASKGVTLAQAVSNVTKWADQSGKGNDFTVGFGTSTVAQSAVGGHPAIDLSNGSLQGLTGFATNEEFLFTFVVTGLPTPTNYGLFQWLSGGEELTSNVETGGFLRATQINGQGVRWSTTSQKAINDGLPHIVTLHVNTALEAGVGAEMRVDGAPSGTPGVGVTKDMAGQPLSISSGKWSEVLFVDGVVTAGQISNVEGYLKTKYGL